MRVRFLVAQECEDEIRDGIETVKELISYASSFKREPIRASELIIGMKCGGSDGFVRNHGKPYCWCIF